MTLGLVDLLVFIPSVLLISTWNLKMKLRYGCEYLATLSVGALLGFASLSAGSVSAATLTPGNILVSTKQTVTEYTLSGNIVQTFSVPLSPSATESTRDIAVDSNGGIQVYNGTFDPILSTINTETGAVSNTTFLGWSTVNNTTYGGIATFEDKTFVTDMRTFGDGGADQAKGIIAFDNTGATRFATDIGPIDLNIGLDGLLYALWPGGSPSGRGLSVYEPNNLAEIRDIDLTIATGFGGARRGIAVNALGDLFVATLSGEVFHLSSSGALVNSATFDCGRFKCRFSDIDIAPDGALLLSSPDGFVLSTNEALASPSFLISNAGFGTRFTAFVPEPTSSESVPEPLGVLGAGVAFGFGVLLNKERKSVEE